MSHGVFFKRAFRFLAVGGPSLQDAQRESRQDERHAGDFRGGDALAQDERAAEKPDGEADLPESVDIAAICAALRSHLLISA